MFVTPERVQELTRQEIFSSQGENRLGGISKGFYLWQQPLVSRILQ